MRRDFASVQAVVSQQSELLGGLTKKIDGIAEAFHQVRHTSVSEVSQILQVIVYCTVIVGSVVTGIVYVASNSNAGDVAVARYRLEQVERRLNAQGGK